MKQALLVLWVLGLAPAWAQEADKAGQGSPGEKTARARGPRLGVEPASFDFGRALPNRTLAKEFTVHNYGTEDLVIESVSTSCGCTVAHGYAKVVKPGASTPLRVSLETRNTTGRTERKVVIRTNDPESKLFELRIEATVAGPERK